MQVVAACEQLQECGAMADSINKSLQRLAALSEAALGHAEQVQEMAYSRFPGYCTCIHTCIPLATTLPALKNCWG